MGTAVGNEDIKELRKTRELCPGEKAVEEALGPGRVERYHVVDGQEVKGEGPDGKYMWRAPYQGNSKDGGKVIELMSPYWRADSERQKKLQARRPQEQLMDESGSVRHVPSWDADEAANRNGWHSPGRIVGVLARDVVGDFCQSCDRLKVWCECKETPSG